MNKNVIKFSIIIATYNSSKKLSKTLDSILSKNFDDYEVIVIDGASTDETVQIIKSYEEKFNGKLRWISEKDKGVYEAMNKGIEISKGEWLYFLGSGDVLFENDILKKIAKEIDGSNSDVLYGNVELEKTGIIYGGEFTARRLIKGNISHQAIFYKKDIFNIFGYYDTRYKTLADWVFNMQWFNNQKIEKKHVNITVANFELDGISKTIYDKNFYADFENNLRKYFSKDILKDFKGILRLGYILFKNEYFWRFWKWKNRMVLMTKNPKYFIGRCLDR